MRYSGGGDFVHDDKQPAFTPAEAVRLKSHPLEQTRAFKHCDDDHHTHHQENHFPVDVGQCRLKTENEPVL